MSDEHVEKTPQCPNCGSRELEHQDTMPGEQWEDALEVRCAHCGHFRGLVR